MSWVKLVSPVEPEWKAKLADPGPGGCRFERAMALVLVVKACKPSIQTEAYDLAFYLKLYEKGDCLNFKKKNPWGSNS